MPDMGSAGARRMCYFTSHYPKISHSFIRREILALEREGWEIHRFALRGWDADVLDHEDKAEREQTAYVLKSGIWRITLATIAALLQMPGPFFNSLKLAFWLMRRSDRPSILHLIYFAEACWLARELKKRQLSHIHVHFGTNPTDVALLIHRLTGLSFSFTVHGPEEFDRVIGINLKTKVEMASFVVAISSFGKAQLMRLVHPLLWTKIKVIHCGVDSRFFIEVVKAVPTRRLVCVGRLCEQKGQALLVSAAADLVDRGEDFELVLVGDGEHRPIIEDMIERYQLQGKVRIAGWADGETVRKEILASRALVLPSFAEGLAVVLMEAMALGRPVLTTYIAGNPELIDHDANGWLVPAGDRGLLADAMQRCLGTEVAVLQAMGENATRAVMLKHNVSLEAKKLSDLFVVALGA